MKLFFNFFILAFVLLGCSHTSAENVISTEKEEDFALKLFLVNELIINNFKEYSESLDDYSGDASIKMNEKMFLHIYTFASLETEMENYVPPSNQKLKDIYEDISTSVSNIKQQTKIITNAIQNGDSESALPVINDLEKTAESIVSSHKRLSELLLSEGLNEQMQKASVDASNRIDEILADYQ